MVSIVPTTHHAYKGFWFSPEGDHLMDQGKPPRPSIRKSASQTDSTSLQSLLTPHFPDPTPPPPVPQTQLPVTTPPRTSRKRKASDVGGLAMPEQQRHRLDDTVSGPQTINPQRLTATTTAPGGLTHYPSDYASISMAPSSYATWQSSMDRRGSAQGPNPQYYAPQPWVPDSSPGPSRTGSVTSTETLPMTYNNPMTYGYDPSPHYQQPTYPSMYPPVIPSTNQPSHQPQIPSNQGIVYPPTTGPPPSTTQPPSVTPDPQQRDKPRCWEHGCNGREFSTFSNFLRHQRERSGTAPRAYCPRCGAEFTRTTARTNHLLNSKCKSRRSSG